VWSTTWSSVQCSHQCRDDRRRLTPPVSFTGDVVDGGEPGCTMAGPVWRCVWLRRESAFGRGGGSDNETTNARTKGQHLHLTPRPRSSWRAGCPAARHLAPPSPPAPRCENSFRAIQFSVGRAAEQRCEVMRKLQEGLGRRRGEHNRTPTSTRDINSTSGPSLARAPNGGIDGWQRTSQSNTPSPTTDQPVCALHVCIGPKGQCPQARL
jgi:hypothetical protein